jgi:hypothetical protein
MAHRVDHRGPHRHRDEFPPARFAFSKAFNSPTILASVGQGSGGNLARPR